MSPDAPLARLGALHGIAADYHDIWGNRHETSAEAYRSLLAAMDIPTDGDDAIAASLAAAEASRWSAPLPPVVVVRQSALPLVLDFRLPASALGGTLAWSLREENGTERRSEFRCDALRETASVNVNGEAYSARSLVIDARPGFGYHELAILRGAEPVARTRVIVVPDRCYRPDALRQGGRAWGAATQLYGVRSARNWGIGDFTDLRVLVSQWGAHGAGVLGVNPLHALFPHNPAHASPYSPSSRLFLNVLYVDLESVPDFAESAEGRAHVESAAFQARLRALREAELVDYEGVASVKREVAEIAYAHFRRAHLAASSERAQAFRAFQREGGEPLRRHALFEALQERLHRDDPAIWGWPAWPEAYRDPRSDAVKRFAAEHAERVEFYEYLQWLADLQLGAVGRRSFELGLGVGLYQDLAVSIDRAGAEAWANQSIYALTASVGAPPDDFNLKGQDWGLPPMIPDRLADTAYEPFIATLRANMRHAGALRIDHVMGLARLFWIPPGGRPADGTYVRYPFADLLGILALESHRNRCLVIGEDLGTVPDAVREALGEAGVLSYRLLYFERDPAGNPRQPDAYPEQALVAASTHDLPTLAGFWAGRDLALRTELDLFPTEELRHGQFRDRARDRAEFLIALDREGLLPAGMSADPASAPEMSDALARALHAYIARSPAALLVVQLEDVLGAVEQANLPGTTVEQPNWRRKLDLELELWPADERFLGVTEMLARERGIASAAKSGGERGLIVPRATYRLQFHRDFTFDQAADLVPYLDDLGVSHAYCSPYLRARPGSGHGYDIIDHNALNPEIGDEAAFDRFNAALRAHGMGQILDFVPNHMGIMGADNEWWMDVLENGRASLYARFFDIDWDPVNPAMTDRILVPVLGDHYGLALERGEVRVVFEADRGGFAVRYFEHRFPVDPGEYPRILSRARAALSPIAAPPEAIGEFESLVAAFGHLPARSDLADERITERNRDKEIHKRRLARLVTEHPALAEAIDSVVRGLNGRPDEPSSFDALHELLEAQAFRLAYWRVASDEINYRRFFDINDLAALRMEDETVFEATHRLVLELARAGTIDGIRLDHPDGLYDPAGYFMRLQERFAAMTGAPIDARHRQWPLYVLVEKIAGGFEHVPTSWAVHGTTGYRFATVSGGLFVERRNAARMERIYRAFIGRDLDFDDVAYDARRLIMRTALASELTVLANRLHRIAQADRRTRDYTLNRLRQALSEVAACFPVYRTYVRDRSTAADRRYIDWAVRRAKHRSTAADTTIFDFVRGALIGEALSPELAPAVKAFAMKFQQFTAPVAAKGIEDTAFYRYNRLASLNEVGGDPATFGVTVNAFHGASRDRARNWPHTMLASSTHDAKRSEDVRARISVLSEMPAAWRLALRRWSRMNRSKKRPVDDVPAPSANDEYLLYQTLVGTWPLEEPDEAALAAYCARIEAYMVKAVREAKLRSSWINVNEDYESALVEFVRALLTPSPGNLFLQDFASAQRAIARLGLLNSLSLTAIKLASPGVPDFYQGTELFDFSLVDPDNRRPVDFGLRRAMLADLKPLADLPPQERAAAVRGLVDTIADGRAKLYLAWRGLALRAAQPELFASGEYVPLVSSGQHGDRVVAFARRNGSATVVVVAPRLVAGLVPDPAGSLLPLDWGDTAIHLDELDIPNELENVLTGERHATAGRGILRLSELLAQFPAALLVCRNG